MESPSGATGLELLRLYGPVLAAAATLLVGAAAIVAHFITRLVLDRRQRREEERRLAFVYLIQCTNFVAADIVMRSYGERISGALEAASIPPELREPIHSMFGIGRSDYATSHAACVLLAEMFANPSFDEQIKSSQLSWVSRGLRTLAQSVRRSQLSSEQLAKLPRSAIENYVNYVNYVSMVEATLEIWAETFESGNRTWITADTLHSQVTAFSEMIKAAKELYASLIAFGAASKKEADALVAKAVARANLSISRSFAQAEKLKAAKKAAI